VKKAEKIGIIAALCGIILLFLIASTDFVLEENRKEVYTIAFVTDGSADDRFQSLRKGMEKAAKKWNVDLGCTISQWKCCRAGGCDRRGGGKWRAGGDHSAGRPGTDGKISGSE